MQVARLYETRYRAGFPRIEEKTPIALPAERFGPQARMPDIRFEVFEAPPPLRHWFLDETGTQLVQVQRDWFGRNWRKTESDPEYRRYDSVREPFAEDVGFLASFVEDAGIGSLKPVQCEITYINEIRPAERVWIEHGDLSAIMRVWRDDLARTWLPKPEEAQFAVAYRLTHEGRPVGRLRISAQPAFTKAEDRPIYLLNLTARGEPLTGDLDGVLDFIDLGHEWIVRAFESVTSDVMHDLWEKESNER